MPTKTPEKARETLMKHNPPPSPAKYDPRSQAWTLKDPRVKRWAQILGNDPDARLRDLTEQQQAAILSEVERQRGGKTPTLFFEAMAQTTPVVAAPDMDDVVEDLRHVMAQPEMIRAWHEWQVVGAGSGQTPHWADVKGLMMTAAIMPDGAHFEGAYTLYKRPEVRAIFLEVEGGAAYAAAPPRLVTYESLMKQLRVAAVGCEQAMITANVQMLKQLKSLYPHVGTRLMIDGSMVPAWAKQRGVSKEHPHYDEIEAEFRKFTPEAGYRVYSYTKNGKVDSADKITVYTKHCRGYFTVLIADQSLTLPAVWMTFDVASDEAYSAIPLLELLHKEWPELQDVPEKVLVGDSAWDEVWACRLCEQDYGIHPVFRLHRKPEEGKAQDWVVPDGKSKRRSVMKYDHYGRLCCHCHQQYMEFTTAEAPKRFGLKPGALAKGLFRVRTTCTTTNHLGPACGQLGLTMAVDWRRLTWYPHYREGHPRRYAMRQALLVRLNGIESIFNRLKCGKSLGTKGADRTRIRDLEVNRALISVAFTSMTAFGLADERRERGLAPYPPPSVPPAGAPNPIEPSTVLP